MAKVMNFHEPEVIEMGSAEQLVELWDWVNNAENLEPPQTSRGPQAVYISDAE